MPSKTPPITREEPQTGPDATPIANPQKVPTGGLLEPTTPHYLPDPFTDPGPLLDPVPTVDLTKEDKEKKQTETAGEPGLVDPRVLQPGPVDEN